jgi:UDP-glucose 4-epimerase
MAVCLVTGGAGFIGSHLVDALLARGHAVRVLDNFSTGTVANLAQAMDRIELVLGDLTNLDLVRQAVQGVELLFHHAAPVAGAYSALDASAAHHAYMTGTRHVLIAAREAGVRRLVYASSSTVYGRSSLLPLNEESATGPVSPYAAAKLTGEQDCTAFTGIYGLETVRLRYFNVFGPRQSGSMPYSDTVLQALRAMLAGRHPVVPGDGLEPEDLLSVHDVVHANLLVAEAPRVAGRVYNIGRGRPTTPREVVATLNTILGTRNQPVRGPARARGDYRHLADTSRAETELGFCPSTDLEAGLRLCVDSYTRWREEFPEAPAVSPVENLDGASAPPPA